MPHGGKGALDRVRGSEVFPVFGGEIVESEQGLAILRLALGALSYLRLGLTRIGGHPEGFVRGGTDAENTPAVFTRVSPPDGGARACWT